MNSLTRITKCATENSLVRICIYIYLATVGVATIYGASRGFIDWTSWLSTREYRNIVFLTIEPIVNGAVDGGVMVLMVAGSAILSGSVALTAPVSVPVILIFASK